MPVMAPITKHAATVKDATQAGAAVHAAARRRGRRAKVKAGRWCAVGV